MLDYLFYSYLFLLLLLWWNGLYSLAGSSGVVILGIARIDLQGKEYLVYIYYLCCHLHQCVLELVILKFLRLNLNFFDLHLLTAPPYCILMVISLGSGAFTFSC